MNIRKVPPTCAAIAILAAAPFTMSAAESHPVGVDAVFVDHAAMRNWQADGERGLWIQAGNPGWFYVRFARVCHGLSSTNSLAFETLASGRIDRTSAVIMPGGARCPVQRIGPSGAPPQARVEPAPQTQ
jgi:acetyl-CoA acetyltransferase